VLSGGAQLPHDDDRFVTPKPYAMELSGGTASLKDCRRGARELTCAAHVSTFTDMSPMIQIRNVPDDLHRQLKARAALEGLSLSDFLLREARRVAERPTLTELQRRLERRERVRPRVPPARAVRKERDGR